MRLDELWRPHYTAPMTDTLLGTEIGRLTVVSLSRREGYTRYYVCRCACGNTVERSNTNLIYARRKGQGSCGCLRRDLLVLRNFRHGGAKTAEYRVWNTMMNRCTNPNYHEFAHYGERGITVSSAWRDFAIFLKDMGPRPSPRHQLDRKKNNLGYSKGNCHWVLPKVQQRNKRNTIWVRLGNERVTLAELAERAGLRYITAYTRYKAGWSPARIYNTPVK